MKNYFKDGPQILPKIPIQRNVRNNNTKIIFYKASVFYIIKNNPTSQIEHECNTRRISDTVHWQKINTIYIFKYWSENIQQTLNTFFLNIFKEK